MLSKLAGLLVNKSNSLFTDLGLLALRLAFGFSMAFAHGWGKLQGWEKMSEKFFDPFGLGSATSLAMAIGAEVGCSLLLVVGLGTRLALIPLLITMLVAFFMVHGSDPWAKKEMAFLYLSAYVTLLAAGPGRLSLDALIAKKLAPETV